MLEFCKTQAPQSQSSVDNGGFFLPFMKGPENTVLNLLLWLERNKKSQSIYCILPACAYTL
jgi:hypothetical protein